MRNVFNLDGPLFTALNKLSDMIILNLLFVVCSLPIITIGASWTALYYVMLKIREGEEGYIVRSFFKSFKQNFRQATVIWLILLAAGLIMFLDFRIMRSYEGTLGTVIRVSVYLGVILWFMVFMYVFPLLARFENSIKQTMQNALLLALANAPKTLIMLIIMIGSIFLTLWNATTLVWGILIWLLLGFSVIAYVNCMFQVPIFHRISPPKPEEDSENAENTENTENTENKENVENAKDAEVQPDTPPERQVRVEAQNGRYVFREEKAADSADSAGEEEQGNSGEE